MIKVLQGYLDREWRTKDKILYFLKYMNIDVNERALRDYFAEFNERYESGDTEMFIAHSQKGYLLTNDPKIIMDSLEDDNKRAMKLMKRYYRCKKALSDKNQLSLTSNESDLYEVIMKMES